MSGPVHFLLRVLAAAWILGLVHACRGGSIEPPVFHPERLEFVRAYRLRDASQIPKSAAAFGSVRVVIVALEEWPADFGEPLADRARLIGSTAKGDYLRPTQRLALDARVGSLTAGTERPGAGRSQVLAESRGVWADGVETRFLMEAAPAGAPRLSSVSLNLTTDPGGGLRVVLELHGIGSLIEAEDIAAEDIAAGDSAAGDNAAEDNAAAPLAAVPITESVHFVLNPSAAGTLCFVVRPEATPTADPAGTVPTQAIALLLELEAAGAPVDPRHEEDVAVCRAALAEPSTLLTGAPSTPGRTDLLALLSGVESGLVLRPRLAYLGRESGASVAEDLALSLPADQLAELCARLPLAAMTASDETGLWLQVACLTVLARRVAEGTAGPDLEALLVRHTGELARNPLVLIEVLQRSTGLEDLEERLVRANRLFLGDSLASARLRAFDWLDRRGQRPAGYEPLAPREARREVLRTLQLEWEADPGATSAGEPR